MNIFSALTAAVCALCATPLLAQELTGTLKKVKDNRSVAIGHREASVGFSHTDGSSKPIGYSLEICNRIIDEIKKEIKTTSLEIKYQLATSTNRIPLATNDTVDIEFGMMTTLIERQQQVDFRPIFFATTYEWM